MRAPLKKPVHSDVLLAAALARHLLSPSREFESAAECARDAMTDGMRVLAALDKPTRLSLPILSPHAPAQPLLPNPSNSPKLPTRFESARQEYRGALTDRTIVNALLELHQSKRGLGQAPLSGFQLEQVPSVQAQPKPQPRGPRGATPVYRSRGPVASRTKPKE